MGGMKFAFFLFMVGLMSQSCVSYKDMVTLGGSELELEDLQADSLIAQNALADFQRYKIRPFDQLIIQMNAFSGSTEEFISQEFSFGRRNNNNVNFEPQDIYFNSYVVNDSGYIRLPLLEDIKVSGLTPDEVKYKLDEAYKPYLKFASSKVKLANQRVTVLGEVFTPGVYYLYNDQNTILDALSIAGDMTEFGNRGKVQLLRRTEDGELKTVFLNLNRSGFVTSEYYFVQPNDVIYVEPLKTKSFEVSARSIGLVFAGISSVVLIANLFVR